MCVYLVTGCVGEGIGVSSVGYFSFVLFLEGRFYGKAKTPMNTCLTIIRTCFEKNDLVILCLTEQAVVKVKFVR